MTRTCDVVVIGAGHDGLVAAAYLARAGMSVEVFERDDVAGGAVRSQELTEPGYNRTVDGFDERDRTAYLSEIEDLADGVRDEGTPRRR